MLSITGEDTEIGELNPIRYRGYYQDVETGLYYLQSRYYDPTTMRFINADDPNVIQMGSTEKQELNLYAYCVNDPVNCVDPSGYDAVFLLEHSGVYYLGHAALLVSSGSGWYYFSLNGKTNAKKSFGDWFWIGSSKAINQYITIRNINQKIKTYASRNNGTIKTYTRFIYFKGNYYGTYTSAGSYARQIKAGTFIYNAITNNCTQVVCSALAKGNIKTRTLFLGAIKHIYPNAAYTYLLTNKRFYGV